MGISWGSLEALGARKGQLSLQGGYPASNELAKKSTTLLRSAFLFQEPLRPHWQASIEMSAPGSRPPTGIVFRYACCFHVNTLTT